MSPWPSSRLGRILDSSVDNVAGGLWQALCQDIWGLVRSIETETAGAMARGTTRAIGGGESWHSAHQQPGYDLTHRVKTSDGFARDRVAQEQETLVQPTCHRCVKCETLCAPQ